VVRFFEHRHCCHSLFVPAGLSKEKLSHQEVLEVGKKAAADFARLLQAALSI
jgi:purine nucleoside phosphorylase